MSFDIPFFQVVFLSGGWCFISSSSAVLVDWRPDLVFRPWPCQVSSASGKYFAAFLVVRPVQVE